MKEGRRDDNFEVLMKEWSEGLLRRSEFDQRMDALVEACDERATQYRDNGAAREVCDAANPDGGIALLFDGATLCVGDTDNWDGPDWASYLINGEHPAADLPTEDDSEVVEHPAYRGNVLNRVTHCWSCKSELVSSFPHCSVCGWIECPKCSACKCNSPYPVTNRAKR